MIILRNKNFGKVEFPDKMYVVSKKTNEELTLDKWKPGAFTRFLQKCWEFFGIKSSRNCTSFTIYDKDRNYIGDLDLEHVSDDELHVEWIILKNSKQNLGYGKAILQEIINFARDNGYKIISLEVPFGKSQKLLGTSDSAKYVYESLGFIPTGKMSNDLLEMKLVL